MILGTDSTGFNDISAFLTHEFNLKASFIFHIISGIDKKNSTN